MVAIRTARAQRGRRNSERTVIKPCTIKRQLLRQQQERLQKPTFHPFMRLPAELKLCVVQNTDVYALKSLATSCHTMWKLWQQNMEAIWSVILKERYPLESEVVGPAESFSSFNKSDGEKQNMGYRRNAEQEAVLEAAVEVVLRRKYYRWGSGGTLTPPPLEELIMRVRKGGFGYLELLDEMKSGVTTDLETLTGTGLLGALGDPTKRLGYRERERTTSAGDSEDDVEARLEAEHLASMGMTKVKDFRPAIMLLWRLQWWRIEREFDPTSYSLSRRRFRGLTDDERLQMVAEQSQETKEQFKVLLEVFAWKLGKIFGLDDACRIAVADEIRLENNEGGDRQIHQLKALLNVEMDVWMMRETIERGLRFIVEQARHPRAEFGWKTQMFGQKKISYLRYSSLRGTISNKGVFDQKQTDLVSRVREVLEEGKTELYRE
ncbi:MAG: hypothetical protein M1830_000139 [Pleopsidium flavum]|nr:MAG: hypothetical protein M1830_000139 [Pleopsidium flavum]